MTNLPNLPLHVQITTSPSSYLRFISLVRFLHMTFFCFFATRKTFTKISLSLISSLLQFCSWCDFRYIRDIYLISVELRNYRINVVLQYYHINVAYSIITRLWLSVTKVSLSGYWLEVKLDFPSRERKLWSQWREFCYLVIAGLQRDH